ncbi:MAG: ribosomal protein L11 methyltransferase [marine bacterium B5-7]|nr:MAG: ribosomal protein L11 methyltransferase [marine bacterium B5-7]
MPWQQLTIPTTAEAAESLEDLLSEWGAVAVTLQDAGDDPILEPGVDATPLWAEAILTALFTLDENLDVVLLQLQQHCTPEAFSQITKSLLPDQAWERAWLQDFKPMHFGHDLWVCPSTADTPNDTAKVVWLDPGLAFGSGTHETTSLCLQWLAAHPPVNESIIDFGCGSGILAIAALTLGAKHVLAIDNDPQAIDATLDNATRNTTPAHQLTCRLPNDKPLPASPFIVANILAAPLIELAPQLSAALTTNGTLLLSGILAHQADSVVAAYAPQCQLVDKAVAGDWVRLVFSRRS